MVSLYPMMTKILKRLSLIVLTVFLFGLLLPGQTKAQPSQDGVMRRVRVPILMYHYISDPPDPKDELRGDLSVTPDHFREQMQWLKENDYHPITPDDLANALTMGKKLPKRAILLTFDDGYIDAYTNAYPILKEFGFSGTFFVVTSWVDEGKSGYINWDMARQMVKDGMYIQSHSRSHYDMRNRSHDWLVSEIVTPQDAIEKQTGIRPKYFCYPSGGYDNLVINALRDAGYVAAFTENDSVYEFTDNMYRMPRVRIRGRYTTTQFAQTVTWIR